MKTSQFKSCLYLSVLITIHPWVANATDSCSDQEMVKQLELIAQKETNGVSGICDSAQAMNRMNAAALSILDKCPSNTPDRQSMRKEIQQSVAETNQTISQSCNQTEPEIFADQGNDNYQNNTSSGFVDTIQQATQIIQTLQSQKTLQKQQQVQRKIQAQQQSTYNYIPPVNNYTPPAYQNQEPAQPIQSSNNTISTTNNRANYINSGCINIQHWGTGVASDVKKITSTCRVPVEVTFCFHSPGRVEECGGTTGWGTSNKIPPGGNTLVVQPTKSKSAFRFYVCDMSTPNKLCLSPNR